VVAGRAAPQWMTRLLPGLRLARFRFSRMRNRFSMRPDGRTINRMVFQGRYYHLYADGYTTPDKRINYEVGIDLLAGLDSAPLAEAGTGRIPLFTKQGRIAPGGILLDETVRYVPPHKLMFELLRRNNLVTAAYYALKRRVQREQQPGG